MIKGLNRTPPNPGETKEGNWIFTAFRHIKAEKKKIKKNLKNFDFFF